ncbi:MAG: hypothetical protein ACRDKA_05865 [Actinomycetota bacterium]
MAAVVALLVLSACGGGEGDGVASAGGVENPANPGETEETPLDEDAQALVFANCMRDNGIDMPDPGPGRRGLVEAFRAVSGDYDRTTMQKVWGAETRMGPLTRHFGESPASSVRRHWIFA